MAPKTTTPDELTALEVAQQLAKAIVDKIGTLKADLIKMQEREADGAKTLNKSEDFIDVKNANDPKKRIKTFKSPKTVLPGDKPEKEISAEGSGGNIKKDELTMSKAGAGPAGVSAKPTGVPGAPKPPQAPGAAPTMHKMAIPTSTEKANGGPQPTKKMEFPTSAEKANGGPQPTKKMEFPATGEKANGGPMAKMAMSPVFGVKPRLGGKDTMSQAMTHDASKAAAAAPAQALPHTKLPTVTEHAQRAASFQNHMASGGHASNASSRSAGISLPDAGGEMEIERGPGQFANIPGGYHGLGKGEVSDKAKAGQNKIFDRTKITKSEMDSVKCPSCKSGMTLCKCLSQK
jgi:hypothetical protein